MLFHKTFTSVAQWKNSGIPSCRPTSLHWTCNSFFFWDVLKSQLTYESFHLWSTELIVNPGSKAYHQGLLEGDLLKMVNGYFTDGLSQMDVQNIIKETGTHLTLEVERNPIQPDIEKTYTARTTITLNGSPNHMKLYSVKHIPSVLRPSKPMRKEWQMTKKKKKVERKQSMSASVLLALTAVITAKNHVLPDPEIPHFASRTKIWEDGE
ncbi:PDZ domain-containing protein [Trichonephila inaurata madagascariensis]|uniref:PDZ domain-containing protein n=1 Tax=Trichonephila inaurata madagascariensis TaxID=2747483 RepID=A0A8X7BU25_9ARAC|nr:PDZ domain-containing protein [Trichonephila inaurata madagascariensis]